jgi:uncharacterized membrane protein
MILAGWILLLAGLLIVFASESAARGHLGLNSIVGLRFGYILVSDEAWLAGHRAARIVLDIAGSIFVVTGVLVLMLPLPENTMGAIVLASAVGVVLLVVVAGIIGNRAARAVVLEMVDTDQ